MRFIAGVTSAETTARDEIVRMYKRVRHLDLVVAEIQEFIWPIVDKVFPNLLSHLQAKCLQGVSRFIGRVPE